MFPWGPARATGPCQWGMTGLIPEWFLYRFDNHNGLCRAAGPGRCFSQPVRLGRRLAVGLAVHGLLGLGNPLSRAGAFGIVG